MNQTTDKKPLALIVDDEEDILELLEMTLARMEINTKPAANLATARALLSKHSFNLCLTDMILPDGDGLELVEYIQSTQPQLPVAVITAHGSIDTAIRAMKSGAYDFVAKPVELKRLRQLVTSALKLENDPAADSHASEMLLGESPLIQALRSKIAKLARSQAPIHICGESGSGKELVARLIHQKGPRRDQTFVAVNCGAIPAELMESEFFGHKKGSFSGAYSDKTGLFQAADGGTLFLDEVADLPLALQVKLLRAIQEKSVRAVGDQHETAIDVRILSATHKNLAQMVEAGEFRQDLFYRINVIELQVPPLRERPDDIALLCDFFLTKLSERNQQPIATLSAAAQEALQNYSFPGNVRELENLLEGAIALSENNNLEPNDLNFAEEAVGTTSPSIEEPLPQAATPPLTDNVSLGSYMDEIEKKAIINALEKTRWNRTKAAKELGISFRALRYRLKKLDLE